MIEELDYDELSPGISGMVRWLRKEHGYRTTDSGDGSNHARGMEGAMPVPMVAIVLDDPALLSFEADVLNARLVDQGIVAEVEASYDPSNRVPILVIHGEGLLNFEPTPGVPDEHPTHLEHVAKRTYLFQGPIGAAAFAVVGAVAGFLRGRRLEREETGLAVVERRSTKRGPGETRRKR